ncbi:short-chain dehydrogenase/reductase SDR [Leadbetterella byssophila DSM 17132]|uniref:Short-chain dehydrogenase/reductase SDR n=1 Tax=Leadbetterella byssophila (strain DSM 17132 / JCM 16389 / KACC 11308 / NBRC 106382 / 4M15) TaxID=649349 RepID=E4RWY2_LEAB4|nr:3-oxoacyl-ACP reductase FabG [Leadbetterella byssophila]ADQ17188.1 short-chain dehydrogenase/reductase SDR [Leadbetterella byssophila DSM 17132]
MIKWAIVTGGSRGIGRAICRKLAEETPYKLLINYHSNHAAAEETLAEVKALGGDGEVIKFDVADKHSTLNALESWQKDHPDAIMEVVVNNAGITRDGLFMWMNSNDWNEVIQTSLNGFYHVTNFFIQGLLRNKYGRIVNITSVSGLKGTAGQVNYSAAKGAIVAATKALAQEVAKRNITVNAVAPGFIRSDMTGELNEAELKKLIPLGRFGEAEEVAELVNFLVSKKSSYITGEIININGGIYS